MENKAAESTEAPFTTDPLLVETIVEVLTNEVKGIQQFLDRNNLLEND